MPILLLFNPLITPSAKDLRQAIREAIVAAINGSTALQMVATGITVTYRPTRAPIVLPAITMYDLGEKIDNVVPLYRRTFHIDIWTRLDLDNAEAIAHVVNGLLDHQAVVLPNGEGQVAFIMLESDSDQPQYDADLVRKMLTYTMLVYEYNGPLPSSG